jgi:hypothetical protein
VLHNTPARLAAAAVAGSALMISVVPAANHWMKEASTPTGVDQADAFGLSPAGTQRTPDGPAGTTQGKHASKAPEVISMGVASSGRHRKMASQAFAAGYDNPLRAVSGLVPERVDEGVDFSGSGPVYAIGDGVVTNASGVNYGWPGGGWITYQLTNGPDRGLMVYLAEDVTPAVQVGQHVTASTVIGNMFQGGDGIETGWAEQSGDTAESQMAEAGGIGGYGPFPTMIGLSFDQLLQSLGAPAAPNANQAGYGTLPAAYPR